MKTETIKQAKPKALEIVTNSRLDKAFNGNVLSAEKLAQANVFLTKYPLPEDLKKTND